MNPELIIELESLVVYSLKLKYSLEKEVNIQDIYTYKEYLHRILEGDSIPQLRNQITKVTEAFVVTIKTELEKLIKQAGELLGETD